MPYPALPFAAALGAAPAVILAAGFLETVGALIEQAWAYVAAGYRQVPVLVLVLSALLVLPAGRADLVA